MLAAIPPSQSPRIGRSWRARRHHGGEQFLPAELELDHRAGHHSSLAQEAAELPATGDAKRRRQPVCQPVRAKQLTLQAAPGT